ncbi:MAG: hypothetical protein C4576_34060 [Desulfobacteraceae bacterium]|nr:MAG: hypothetical protein C4576_34060 [Desulfobacteraceae bacterium]
MTPECARKQIQGSSGTRFALHPRRAVFGQPAGRSRDYPQESGVAISLIQAFLGRICVKVSVPTPIQAISGFHGKNDTRKIPSDSPYKRTDLRFPTFPKGDWIPVFTGMKGQFRLFTAASIFLDKCFRMP